MFFYLSFYLKVKFGIHFFHLIHLQIIKTYSLNLPESESYDTLGGLIVFNKEEIPKVGEEIIINGYSIQILHASSSKIEKVVLKKTHQE